MALNTIDGRIIEKISTIPGTLPTIAPSFDHTDGTWSATDIYEGELFVNVADEKVYTRCGTTIVELTPVTPPAPQDLADTLAEGNSTGANNIEISNNQFAKYVTQPATQVGFDDLTVVTKKFVDDSIAAYVPPIYGLDEVLMTSNNTGGQNIQLDQGSTIAVDSSAPTNPNGGVATLVSGTVTVFTTMVEADSIILLTHQNNIGVPGAVHINARTPGVSFEIESTQFGDLSDIGWFILKQF